MNLQARLYDPVIGRFLAVDPFSGTQVGISPYHYCYNDPINLKDVLGLFPPKDHANFGDWWLNSYWMDIFYSENAAIHFDNCPDFGAVKRIIDAAGGFGKLNTHTQGDFFSHSNYVDLWVNGGYSGVMPLWDEIDWESDFGKDVRTNLKTTSYHNSSYTDNDHDDGYNFGQFGAKDNLDDLLEIAGGDKTLIEKFTKLYNTATDATKRQMARNRTDAENRQLQARLALIQTAAFEAIMSFVNPVYRAARDLRNSYNASAADAFWMASNALWSSNMGMKSRNSWNGLWQSEGTNLYQSYMDEYISDMNSISESYYMTGVSCKINANVFQSIMDAMSQ